MATRYPVLEEGIRFYLQDMPDKAMGILNGLK
jgi:hypothetical protein